jgi:hypothetical protein
MVSQKSEFGSHKSAARATPGTGRGARRHNAGLRELRRHHLCVDGGLDLLCAPGSEGATIPRRTKHTTEGATPIHEDLGQGTAWSALSARRTGAECFPDTASLVDALPELCRKTPAAGLGKSSVLQTSQALGGSVGLVCLSSKVVAYLRRVVERDLGQQ